MRTFIPLPKSWTAFLVLGIPGPQVHLIFISCHTTLSSRPLQASCTKLGFHWGCPRTSGLARQVKVTQKRRTFHMLLTMERTPSCGTTTAVDRSTPALPVLILPFFLLPFVCQKKNIRKKHAAKVPTSGLRRGSNNQASESIPARYTPCRQSLPHALGTSIS